MQPYILPQTMNDILRGLKLAYYQSEEIANGMYTKMKHRENFNGRLTALKTCCIQTLQENEHGAFTSIRHKYNSGGFHKMSTNFVISVQ